VRLILLLLATAAWAERPNVVFILSDNQSYYEMSCHGHAQIKTPRIDAFAKESVEFRHFYAPPYCSPSRSVILTGRYAMRAGVFTTIAGRSIMHRQETTLADRLKAAGYRTGIFGKWHLGFSYPHRPEDRGFDEVFVHGGGGVGQMEDYYGNTLFDTTFIHNGKVAPSKGYCTNTLFEQAMAYVKTHRDRPFFCFVSTPVTHSPHHGPKALVAELKAAGVTGNVELFAQVQNLDMNIGRMLDKLAALDLARKTVVIYASDQGMNDRGAPHGGNRMSIGHDPAQHVPFFARVPGVSPRVTERLAGMIDFCPTILDLCGIALPDNMDGLSLKPLLEQGDTAYPERTLIVQCPRGRTAQKWKNSSVKRGPWRLVNGQELYDIRRDPRQKIDIAARHPELVAALRAAYESYWADLPEQSTTLSRHLIGAPECPEVVLNGMDWYRGDSPWNRGAFRGQSNGAWAIQVQRDGRYRIEARHFPREADLPAGATHARLRIGKLETEQALDSTATHASFQLELKAGDYDLETWLTTGKKTRGALFVYIAAMPPDAP
jgi:arylsulfatase A-like enzyme